MKCDLCGYRIDRIGTCQRTCKYDKRTGDVNRGKVCHVGCVEKHHSAHHDTKNPRSLASMAKTI